MSDEQRARATLAACGATIERTKRRIESSVKLLNEIEELQKKAAKRRKARAASTESEVV